jgi:hypothetical protein
MPGNKSSWHEYNESSIKRVLGEDLLSKKFSTQKVVAGLKVMLYNKFMSIYSMMYLT